MAFKRVLVEQAEDCAVRNLSRFQNLPDAFVEIAGVNVDRSVELPAFLAFWLLPLQSFQQLDLIFYGFAEVEMPQEWRAQVQHKLCCPHRRLIRLLWSRKRVNIRA